MKYITTFVLAAGLAASSFLTTPSIASAQTNPGHPEAELVNLETLKTVYLFGTPAQKQLAVQMFDPEFLGIGYGPFGPMRENYQTVLTLVSLFPMLTPDTTTLNEWNFLTLVTNRYRAKSVSHQHI